MIEEETKGEDAIKSDSAFNNLAYNQELLKKIIDTPDIKRVAIFWNPSQQYQHLQTNRLISSMIVKDYILNTASEFMNEDEER